MALQRCADVGGNPVDLIGDEFGESLFSRY